MERVWNGDTVEELHPFTSRKDEGVKFLYPPHLLSLHPPYTTKDKRIFIGGGGGFHPFESGEGIGDWG